MLQRAVNAPHHHEPPRPPPHGPSATPASSSRSPTASSRDTGARSSTTSRRLTAIRLAYAMAVGTEAPPTSPALALTCFCVVRDDAHRFGAPRQLARTPSRRDSTSPSPRPPPTSAAPSPLSLRPETSYEKPARLLVVAPREGVRLHRRRRPASPTGTPTSAARSPSSSTAAGRRFPRSGFSWRCATSRFHLDPFEGGGGEADRGGDRRGDADASPASMT